MVEVISDIEEIVIAAMDASERKPFEVELSKLKGALVEETTEETDLNEGDEPRSARADAAH